MNKTHLPNPAYRIETPRLVLRCWNPADAPLLKNAIDASLAHLRPWMAWAQNEPTDLEAKTTHVRWSRSRFDAGMDFAYGIFNPTETEVWGGCGLHIRAGAHLREIGYWIHVDQVGKGFATELSAALTKVAFEVDGMSRVEIHCDPKNIASARVPEKLGYIHEGTLRKRNLGGEGIPHDTMVWGMLADEYPASTAAQIDIAAFDAVGKKIL